MTVRTFLDLSTAHLSPAARAWLSEAATLNHAANYHGVGHGAAIGTLGATLTGWFLHAPDLPTNEGSDYGMAEDLFPIIRHAHAHDCHCILFDADAQIIDELPVFNEGYDPEDVTLPGDDNGPEGENYFHLESPEGRAWEMELQTEFDRAASEPPADDGSVIDVERIIDARLALPSIKVSTIIATRFEYLEVRPCIETEDGDISSFESEEAFQDALASAGGQGFQFKTYWTLYGRGNDPTYDVESRFLATAIGDFTTKEDAHKIMNAILAPMAKARDLIDANVDIESDSGAVVTGPERASELLTDFINQCSDMERI